MEQELTPIKVSMRANSIPFEGWGTSLAWFAHVLGGAPDEIRNEVADLIFDTKRGLGLNILRYNIGGGENPNYAFMEPRAVIPGYQPQPGLYDWEADGNQRWMLNAALARGADLVEAFVNSPPYWMTVSGSVTGSHGGLDDNLRPECFDAYAEYILTVIRHFRDQWGISFTSVDPLNEPQSDWWKFGGRQEGCRFGLEAQNRILGIVGQRLQQSGLETILAASDENSIDEAVLAFQSYTPEVQSLIQRINTHSYTGSGVKGLGESVRAAGKGLWMSEYGDGDASGLSLSRRILTDMNVLRPTAWVYWQAVDDISGPGWGMLSSDLNHPSDFDYVTNQKYAVMQNYSRFVRPGQHLLEVSDEDTLAAIDPASNTIILVATNTDSDSRVTEYDLTALGCKTGRVELYRSSANERCVHLSSTQFDSSKLRVFLKEQSVTTLVLRDIQGRIENLTAGRN